MERIQNFWAEYGTVIMGILGTGFGAAVMAFLSRFSIKIFIRKIMRKFDKEKFVSEVTERVSQNIAKRLTGSVLDVDISEVVETKVDDALGDLAEQVKEVKQSVESMKECSALTAKAVSKSKLLDKTEQAALVAEAEKLSESVTRDNKPVTKIKIQAKEDKAVSAVPVNDVLASVLRL